jgi:tetratricopeptide (TPR) repeat protein
MTSEKPEHKPEGGFDRIAPADLEARGRHGESLRKRSRSSLPATLLGLAFGVLLLALVGVFVYLPGAIEPVEQPGAIAPSGAKRPQGAAPARASPREDIAPWQQALLARERKAAQDILAELLRKQFELEGRAVERWGAEAFAAAKAKAEAGDELFRSQQYAAAALEYTAGNLELDALLERVEPTLAETLDDGDAALAAADAQAALAAWELALAIEPDNERALRGVARARALPEVLALMQSGAAHEEAGRLTEANDEFRAAAALDAEFAPAREAMTRTGARIADAQFSAAMSAGFAALGRGDYAAARKSFIEARGLDAGAQGPADGLAQVDLNIRLGEIATHRETATAMESAERWQEAAAAYQAALDLDPDLAFAKAGVRRSRARAEISERLAHYLDSPERLTAENVYANALALVRQVAAIPERGPKLAAQITRLEELLKLAVTPVRVRLESDNQTDVVMHRVGPLGNFESREIELRPGTYTVVGTCAGYRDVRREVEVAAGAPPAPVIVRCEEKI